MSPSPVQPHQRIQYLDILRGFAITGVLFAYVFWNLGNEPASSYTSFDKILDETGNFLIDSKCYTILATLFTVGFVLHMNKSTDQARSLFIFRKRLLGLLIIGLLHAFLLRNGDIIAPYAILTFLVTFFYKASTRTIITTIIIVFLVQSEFNQVWRALGYTIPQRPENVSSNYWVENFSWVKYWYQTSIFYWEGTLFLLLGGLLIGRFFIQQRKRLSTRQLILVTTLGFLAGALPYLTLTFYGPAIRNIPDIGNTSIIRAMTYHSLQLMHKLGMASFYGGLFFLLSRNFKLTIFANLGRMSLTNYILQALLVVPFCLVFNMFNHITPTIALIMTAVLWIMQVLFSNWCLKNYQFGPLEWMLRRFTYGSLFKKKEVEIVSA